MRIKALTLIFLIYLGLLSADSIENTRRTAIVKAAERVGPAVVSISVLSHRVVAASPFFNSFWGDFWRDFFPPEYFKEEVKSLGSGIIFDKRGYILTNQHVVENAEIIKVTLPDGRQFDGKLVGADEKRDIAVIKIDGKNLETAPIGNSDTLFIGEWAISIGNPFGFLLEDLQPTVTVGVISAVHRTIKVQEQDRLYRDMIQTDAAINPGNSGGPLVNALGEVIGINTFIFSKSGGSEGMGFAIPINTAMKIAKELIKYGKVREGYIGVYVQNLTLDLKKALDYKKIYGVLISFVDPESPASGKLSEGDIVEKINGRYLYNVGDWEDFTYALIPGDTLRMTVFHNGREKRILLIAKEVKEHGEYVKDFGVTVTKITPYYVHKYNLSTTLGLLILKVKTGSIADRIGLKKGDILLSINGVKISTRDDIKKGLKKARRRGILSLVINRGGSIFQATVSF